VDVALPSSRMNSSAPLVGRPDQLNREAGRVGLMGEGVLSDVVPELFILYRLLEMKIHRSDLVPVATLAVPSNNIK